MNNNSIFGYIKTGVTVFYMLSAIVLFAQSPQKLKTIPVKAYNVFVNGTDQVYILSKGMLELHLLNGSPVLQYGSKYINKHTKIISVNSFKTILYSEDYGKIITLDNRLKQQEIFDIYDLGSTVLVSCVGASLINNTIWIFDAATQKLSKLDENHKVLFTSNSISQALGKEIHPEQIHEFGIYVYLVDEENGIYIFDTQGNYVKFIPIFNAHNFSVVSSKFYYVKDNSAFEYNPLTFTETKFLKTPELKYLHFGSSVLAGINKNNEVEIWTF